MDDVKVRRTGMTAKGETKREIFIFISKSPSVGEPEIRDHLRNTLGLRDQFSIKRHLKELERKEVIKKSIEWNTNYWSVNINSKGLLNYFNEFLEELEKNQIFSFTKSDAYQRYVTSLAILDRIDEYLEAFSDVPPNKDIKYQYAVGVRHLPSLLKELADHQYMKISYGMAQLVQESEKKAEFLQSMPVMVLVWMFGIDYALFTEPEAHNDLEKYQKSLQKFIDKKYIIQPMLVLK